MKALFKGLLFVILASLGAAASPLPASVAVVNDADPLSASAQLLRRVVPSNLVGSFSLELISPEKGEDGETVAVMQLSSDAATGMVILRGSGGVEIASALNWCVPRSYARCYNVFW